MPQIRLITREDIIKRAILKIGIAGVGTVSLALIVGLAWLFFDTHGLSDIQSLAQFTPATEVRTYDPCFNTSSTAVPYDRVGGNLRAAIIAAESLEETPGVVTSLFQTLRNSDPSAPPSLSLRIARTLICNHTQQSDYEISVFRTAVQLDRHFSQRELFTIFVNRLVFDDNIVGVEAASLHFFHKEPDQLDTGESALLAGLVRRPKYYSPLAHPDRALRRRNQVIDRMAQEHIISEPDAAVAKETPLNLARE